MAPFLSLLFRSDGDPQSGGSRHKYPAHNETKDHI
ncbi:MAG: hypothetical protein JWM28_829, partial [Chitinophagaceae bacterium]|nr:hypothetical protein [Chitinophagaceae bacterium]